MVLKAKSVDSTQVDTNKVRTGLLPAPVVIFTPETNFAFGAAVFYFRQPPKTIRADEVLLYGVYSLNHQIIAQSEVYKYFDAPNYFVYSDIKFTRFPDLFFGIGPNSLESDEEPYTEQAVRIDISFMKLFGKNLYIGPSFFLEDKNLISVEEGGLLDTEDIIGNEGAFYTGLGLAFAYDTRNNNIYPEDGIFLIGSARKFGRFIGSEYEFWRTQVDFRRYYGIGERRVFAFNLYSQFTDGYVPYQVLPRLGGSRYMRGFYFGRYTDKYYISGQGEYRTPLFWRFTGTAFLGAGQVAPALDKFQSNIKVAGGLGLRFVIKEEDHLLLRFDAAYSESGFNFYLNVKEAF